MAHKILIATSNRGKISEYTSLMADLNVQLVSVDQLGLELEVNEDGETYEANAIIKAKTYADVSGLLTVADDSGLEVDALNGHPGIKTARFGGQTLSSRQRYRLLLELLKDVPSDERTARFVCVIALAYRGNILGTAKGICSGFIALTPAGEAGFGYDPVFYLPAKDATMAQLSAWEKDIISHRGKAFAELKPILLAILKQSP